MVATTSMNKNIDIENGQKAYESEVYTTDDEQVMERLINGQKKAAQKKSALIIGGALSLALVAGALVYFTGVFSSTFQTVDWSTNKSIGTSLLGYTEYASHSRAAVYSGISCISGYASRETRQELVDRIIENARWNKYNTLDSIRKIAEFVERKFYGSWEDKVGMVIDFLNMNQPYALTTDMYDAVDRAVYQSDYADTRTKMNVAQSLLEDAGRNDAYGNPDGYTVEQIEALYKVVNNEIYQFDYYTSVDDKIAVCKKLLRTGWGAAKVSSEWRLINNRSYFRRHTDKLNELYCQLCNMYNK